MDAEKRLRKKRARENVEEKAPVATVATDLNKKRKISETVTQEIVKEQKTTEAKPWEERAQEDQEVDEKVYDEVISRLTAYNGKSKLKRAATGIMIK